MPRLYRFLNVSNLDFSSDGGQLWIRADATIEGLAAEEGVRSIDLRRLSCGIDGAEAPSVIERFTGKPLSHDADTLLHNAGSINFLGRAFLTADSIACRRPRSIRDCIGV